MANTFLPPEILVPDETLVPSTLDYSLLRAGRTGAIPMQRVPLASLGLWAGAPEQPRYGEIAGRAPLRSLWLKQLPLVAGEPPPSAAASLLAGHRPSTGFALRGDPSATLDRIREATEIDGIPRRVMTRLPSLYGEFGTHPYEVLGERLGVGGSSMKVTHLVVLANLWKGAQELGYEDLRAFFDDCRMDVPGSYIGEPTAIGSRVAKLRRVPQDRVKGFLAGWESRHKDAESLALTPRRVRTPERANSPAAPGNRRSDENNRGIIGAPDNGLGGPRAA